MQKKLTITALTLLPFLASAQFGGFLSKVKNKVNQKVTQRVDGKVDKAIDKTLDEAEGKNTKAETPVAVSTSNETVAKETGVTTFSKYDFVPGEKILFTEDFAQEAIAELPTGWNTNGSGEVVTIQNQQGKWLQIHKSFIYLTNNTKELGENYTIEFDAILRLKNNGWIFPELRFGVLSSGTMTTTDNSLLKEYSQNAAVTAFIQPGSVYESKLKLESKVENKSYFRSNPKEYKELQNYFGKPIHVAIQVQKERFRIWINEAKAFDAPKAVPTDYKMNQLFFDVSHTNYAETDYGIYISNIKVATGVPDTRHKLIEEGKFSTTGILFDVNSATIKPESAGVIKEIGTVLKENPSVKIKIIGHTSSDGDDNANMELSKKRAAAVKDALIKEYSIDASMIETDGKGESQPAGDNKTKEGKVQNRRVEFIKL
jgi:OOP family OmpA-OmpF porin